MQIFDLFCVCKFSSLQLIKDKIEKMGVGHYFEIQKNRIMSVNGDGIVIFQGIIPAWTPNTHIVYSLECVVFFLQAFSGAPYLGHDKRRNSDNQRRALKV